MQLEELSLTLVLTAISSIAAAITCTAVFLQIKTQSRQTQAQLNQLNNMKAETLRTIALDWGDLYKTRNLVLETNLDVDEISTKYGKNYVGFLNSEEWKSVRSVCYFFEQLGLKIHEGLVEADLAFVLVTVDEPDKRMSGKLEPIINYLRQVYKPDLYLYYSWLLMEWERHKEKNGGIAGKKPRS